MLKKILMVSTVFLALTAQPLLASGLETLDFPKTAEILPRLVYGKIVYDFHFKGNGPNTKKLSAEDFLKTVIHSKFSGQKGSYVVALEASLRGEKIATVPLVTADWATEKFLFITTSEKSNIVVDDNGILLDNLIIDNDTNTVKFAVSVYHSNDSTFDLSLFKQLSELSKNSFLTGIMPGLSVASQIYQPFQQIFSTLLSKFEQSKLIELTTGAFTKLDDGFGNQLRYSDKDFVMNVFLQTRNSQLGTIYSDSKFHITDPDVVLDNVKSGVGATRAPVIQIITAGGGAIDQTLTDFTKSVMSGLPYKGSYQNQTSPNMLSSCRQFKNGLNKLLTSRDASLVYWAFLKSNASEFKKYTEGFTCADPTLTESLKEVGLNIEVSELKP